MQGARNNRINALFQLLERELREKATELDSSDMIELSMTIDSLHQDFHDLTQCETQKANS